jgi:hypothetical protein
MSKKYTYLLAPAALVLGLAATADRATAQDAIDFSKEPVNVTNYDTDFDDTPCKEGGECSGNGDASGGASGGGGGMGGNGDGEGGDYGGGEQ